MECGAKRDYVLKGRVTNLVAKMRGYACPPPACAGAPTRVCGLDQRCERNAESSVEIALESLREPRIFLTRSSANSAYALVRR